MGISQNLVMLTGVLGADPEVKTFDNGNKIVNIRLAIDDSYKKGDEWVDRTEWVNVSVRGPAGGLAERNLKKGSRASFVGKLQTRKWTDKDGNDRYQTEVVVGDYVTQIVTHDRKEGGSSGGSSSGGDRGGSRGGASARGDSGSRSSGGGGSGRASRSVDLDDDIPF